MKNKDNILYLGAIGGFGFNEDDISPLEFIDWLNTQSDIEVRINSGGGSVFDAMKIYSELQRHSKNNRVDVYVDGLSASAASFLMFGGSSLHIPENATIMIHKPSTISMGNADELRKDAEALDSIQNSIESIYNKFAKISSVQVHHLMNKETWFSGKEFAENFRCEVDGITDNTTFATAFKNRWQKRNNEIVSRETISNDNSKWQKMEREWKWK